MDAISDSPSSSCASSSTSDPSSTFALDMSRQSLQPSSSARSSRDCDAWNDGDDDSPDRSTAVPSTAGPPGEMSRALASQSDTSPRLRSRGERSDDHFVTTQHRFSGQKRLHPPQAMPNRTGHGCRYDPSLFIPTELLFRCTSYLDPQSLLQLQLASKFFQDLARQNEAGWADLCHNLWHDKAMVAFRDNSSGSPQYDPPANWMQAYFSSLADAKRTSLTLEDLVFDAPDPRAHDDAGMEAHNHDVQRPTALLRRLRSSKNVWSFRFKESAGSDWTGQDPWYSGEPCRKLAFMRDGTILHYLDVPPANVAATDARTTAAPLTNTGYQLKDPPLPMRWRFLSNRPIDLPSRPFGSYVRMSVGGRDVPTYSAFRCEGNWGFVMESCWGLYANFELPPRRQEHPLAGQHQQGEAATPRIPLPIRQRRRLRRTEDGVAVWVVVDEDNESEDQTSSYANSSFGHLPDHPSVQRLQDDTNLFITNEVQWREAFLYNVGALVLPEGDEATSHFDRAWQGA